MVYEKRYLFIYYLMYKINRLITISRIISWTIKWAPQKINIRPHNTDLIIKKTELVCERMTLVIKLLILVYYRYTFSLHIYVIRPILKYASITHITHSMNHPLSTQNIESPRTVGIGNLAKMRTVLQL